MPSRTLPLLPREPLPSAAPEWTLSGSPRSSVTDNLFPLLRVTPAMGRGFSAAENRPGALPVVILSHDYWQARFGGDRGILGQAVTLNASPVSVIGVMPKGFAFPTPEARLWLQLPIDPANPGGRSSHSTHAIGRLARGVDLASAQAELKVLMNDWKAAYPTMHTGHYLFIRPLLEDVAGDIRPALLLLLGATGFVLLDRLRQRCQRRAGAGRSADERDGDSRRARRGPLAAGSLLDDRKRDPRGHSAARWDSGWRPLLVRVLIAIDPDSIPRATEVGA